MGRLGWGQALDALLSQGDRTYLPASFSPHLHSQDPDDAEEMSTERACASLISFDSLFHKL